MAAHRAGRVTTRQRRLNAVVDDGDADRRIQVFMRFAHVVAAPNQAG